MAERYSFQDGLARLHAETQHAQGRLDDQRKYQRMQDYQAGKERGVTLSARIASGARSADEAARNLCQAARQQSNTLTGNVARGDLSETAQQYEAEVERQQPQREADAAYYARAAAIQQRHREWSVHREREWLPDR